MKLQIGSVMPDFTYDTPYAKGKTLYDTIDGRATFVYFLRYLGCTICQLDLHELSEAYGQFEERGAQVLVVLQSDPALVLEQAPEGTYPFEIICDPQQELYRRFEILPAASRLKLASLGTVQKMNRSKKLGFVHGAYEGEELQLPALFLLDASSHIKYSRYAKHLADLPAPAEMLTLL